MMSQAFYTGLSGLRSDQYAIDVVADNMANISTTGFRGSEYEFSSLFEERLATAVGANTIGGGSQIQATSIMTAQGTLKLSDRNTDVAILGDGWFGIEASGKTMYTRDGSFSFDANNELVSLDGYHVLGTMATNIENNELTSVIDNLPLGDIATQGKLSFSKDLVSPPIPTQNTTFSGNLGTEEIVRKMSAGLVDPENNRNSLALVFTKSEDQVLPGIQWDVVATTESLDGETIYDTQTGQVSFSENGALISSSLTSIDNNGALVNIDLGTDYAGIRAQGSNPILASSTADGRMEGELEGYAINKNAEVIATFSNGVQSSVGKIAVYHFQNDQGLSRINGAKFQETDNSGNAVFYKNADGENIIGTDITNFKLEGSNVEMSYGLTELIILQRSYDANSKSISTADQMMQKALSMDA